VAWIGAQRRMAEARHELAFAPEGIARQEPHDHLMAAEEACTSLIHAWLATALGLQRVNNPRIVFSLDVDGVLEDEGEGFSSTTVSGAAALRLLELGGIAVFLNTARSGAAVRERIDQFGLLGGVGAFGATLCDGVFDRERSLISGRSATQMAQLRSELRSDPSVVIDSVHDNSVRASRIVDGGLAPITGQDARRWLDRLRLHDLTFWVAPRHTDFIDRSVNKASGIEQLRGELGLAGLPLAAMGDSSCDTIMLKLARHAFVPAAALASYVPRRGQRLTRCHSLGQQALWEAACQLVPSAPLQRQVLHRTQSLEFPEWFPMSRRRLPASRSGFVAAVAKAVKGGKAHGIA
jgi:3-deoxy-D-manno-octulosonate 8-phosphate phosphatase KdsC-like HAD superfamily phosphatase